VQNDDEEEAKKDDTKDNANGGNTTPKQVLSPNKVGAVSGDQQSRKLGTAEDRSAAKSQKDVQLSSIMSPSEAKGGDGTKSMKASQTFDKSSILLMKRPKEKKKNVTAKIFEGVILSLIIVSSITLVIDNPLSDPDSSEIMLVGYLDNCFTILFTIEMMIKIVAMGFVFQSSTLKQRGFEPYIKNPWNMLDFIVVVSSLFDFIITLQTQFSIKTADDDPDANKATAQSLQSLKALRALRALRPLRMISRNKGMKLIVNALLSSLPSMTNVTIVCTLFLLIFAILGVGFFKGTFGRCSIEDPEILVNILSKSDCLSYNGTWEVPNETFDNTIIATRTLFEMMSTEGWLDVMNSAIDHVPFKDGEQMQPIQDNQPMYILYFVIFMVFGSQFILNLFVGVIMDNFNKIKEKEEMGSLFVTDEQRCWIDA